MLNLVANAIFAVEHGYNLTGRLRHDQVEALASAWFPEIRFHERERFHPIDLETLFSAPTDLFATLPEAARDAFRIEVTTALGTNRFDPPLILTSNDAGSVVGQGTTAIDALSGPSINENRVYTHGATLRSSIEFFGASTTVANAPEPAPGDPRVPRHPPIVVRAEMRFLLEALKHELQLDERGEVLDAVWGRFAVEDSFFVATTTTASLLFPRAAKRAILAALVAAHELTDDVARDAARDSALSAIPPGWALVTRAWDAVKSYAFLEFSFVYAFNDYKEYGTAPFANEHEGDVEGCCVVFERRFLDQFANGALAVEDVVPHTLITSVHEEFNDNDGLKRLPMVRDRARDDLVVYVAPGSHASYLTAGAHDVLDFEDVVTDLPGQLPTWALIAAGLLVPVPFIVLVLLVGLVEHFADSEDHTSDNGASVGPGPSQPGSLVFEKRIDVTPLSNINGDPNNGFLNIYQNAFRAALALRAFPGKWGATDGLIDHSAPWENKTARFFRDFLKYGDIQSEIIT